VILYPDQPYLDIEITLHDKPADPIAEAGWLCLPLKIESPQFRLGRLASIIDPVRDVLPGANRHIFGLNTGLAVTDPQGRGVGICPLDSPLVSLDTPGCWKYTQDFVPRTAVVYVNLFNNQWNTNFRLWNSGTWTSRVRIWAIDRYQSEASLITPSLETRYPLQAARVDGPGGKGACTGGGLGLSRKGVLVTAFGRNPDGPGTLLRLWEYAGDAGPCRVHLPAGLDMEHVQPVTLRGEPIGAPVPVENGEFTVSLPAFAPASYVLSKPLRESL
jgi:hypothetical protein